jgi:uncharacterized protein (TIGR02466 family)
MITLFKANLFCEKNIGSYSQKAELKDYVLDLKNKNPYPPDCTNENCWRFENITIPQWLYSEIDKLVYKTYEFYKEDNIFSRNKKNYNIYNWVNVNSSYSRNTLHSHSKAHLSGIYYLQGKSTGNLRLLNPANILGDCNPTAPYVRDFEFSPTDGDLILWPAWIPHEVEPNYSDLQRINIVFDIIFHV